jgi:copper oxidase (laccase) domain-containing protein
MQWETFAPLAQLDYITHAFTVRSADDTKADTFQDLTLTSLGFDPAHHAAAQQVHGNGVALVEAAVPGGVSGVDALATNTANLPLVVRCADCAAVFIVDRAKRAIALVHSGRTGTQRNIVGNAVATMQRNFGTHPPDCLAVISPCIGPCHYEMDIWSGLEQQLHEAGVGEIHNPRVCTACHLDRYFSYRAEKGKTGRMLAVLSLLAPSRHGTTIPPG